MFLDSLQGDNWEWAAGTSWEGHVWEQLFSRPVLGLGMESGWFVQWVWGPWVHLSAASNLINSTMPWRDPEAQAAAGAPLVSQSVRTKYATWRGGWGCWGKVQGTLGARHVFFLLPTRFGRPGLLG